MNKWMWKPLFSEETIRKYYVNHEMTYNEVAVCLGVTRKVIWTLLKYYGIQTRKPAKRNQWGENNTGWKGDGAKYQAFHIRVENRFGKPKHCMICQTTEVSKSYDWANLTGNYPDPNDYARMCRSCHRKYDRKRKCGYISQPGA